MYGQPIYNSQYLNNQNQFQQIQNPYRFQDANMQYMNNQYLQNNYNQRAGNLQGKSVDNIEVVKAMDIPLDFSISYFPLTDGTAILTKQLMPDGTSKTVVYKPIEESPQSESKSITITDELKKGIEEIKNQIAELTDEIKKSYKFNNVNKSKN